MATKDRLNVRPVSLVFAIVYFNFIWLFLGIYGLLIVACAEWLSLIYLANEVSGVLYFGGSLLTSN